MAINLTTYYYSPLRYPGGKVKLANYFQLLFQYNLLSGGHYVEPYAGGASVALSLLFNEFASVIHINDFDFRIYCFWDAVLNNTEEFCILIEETPVTMETWNAQREIRRNPEDYSKLEIAFSTFFLNRTNRSGILKAGVIGGQNQNGKWKIDARYNIEELISRIKKISRYRERINLYNEDAPVLVNRLAGELPENTLFYFDPPYYNKGRDLYINYYKHDDHVEVSRIVSSIKDQHWVVSYDNQENIKELYEGYLQQTYSLNYHAGNAAKGSEVIIFSNNLIVPKVENPADREQIKRFSREGLFAEWIDKRR